MQAWHITFKNPEGVVLTWIVVTDSVDGCELTPELLRDFIESIVTVHGNCWRYPTGRPSIRVLEVRHVDRALIATRQWKEAKK